MLYQFPNVEISAVNEAGVPGLRQAPDRRPDLYWEKIRAATPKGIGSDN